MTTALTPGDRIQYFGNYELLEEIALGGMGIVWKARQSSLNRIVALKMIRGGMLASAEDVRRFHLEAEAAANLQHPNIVAIHEVGEHDGQHYFSMDFVDGQNLAEHGEGKPLPARQAAELIATIADAVQFAHQRGILHRDLKPQNVMLDQRGTPHLTDFGLAKRMDLDSSLTQDGAVLGSPSYMAPEQAQGRLDRVGPHTDVYALGAILFEMLSGRAPFRGDSPAETMMRVISDAPGSLAKLDPPVPRDLETICLKALEKEPARRYPTARDFADDVRRFLAQEPILARPASALRKAQSWVRRRPWTLAAAAALLVIVMACVIFGLIEQTRFLRAQQLHPGTVRWPGNHTAAMRDLGAISAVAFATLLWTHLLVQKSARRLASWSQLFDAKMHWQPRRAIPPGLAAGAGLIALAVVAYAVFLLGRVISAFVWDGTIGWSEMIMLYPMFWFGFSVLAVSARSLSGQDGASLPVLPPETLAQVENDIRAGEYHPAIKRVRDSAAGASFATARETVEQIAARLETAAPGTLIAPHARRGFNVQGALLCAAAESLLLLILWETVPPRQPIPFLMEFGAQFLLGVSIMLTLRVKGFGRRFLIVLPAVVAMMANEIYLKPRYPGFDFHAGPHLTGLLFGCVLMVAAWSRPRALPPAAPARG
jgi:tRNA A-37 threonylcarbamoyl transferase component Bud32